MTRTFEIIRDFVNNMDLSVEVLSFSGNTLEVCELLSMRVGRIIENDSNELFKITSISGKTVEVVPYNHMNDWSGLTATVSSPTFLQGEWMSANAEYLELDNKTFNKTPLTWLVRGYTETHQGDESSIDFSVNPVIYFLEETVPSGWTNDEHDSNAINPMYRLCERFVQELKDSPLLGEIEDYNITDRPRFGVQLGNNKGSSKHIIDDYLSGVELRINLEVTSCGNNC